MDHWMKSRAHLASVGKGKDRGRPLDIAAALLGAADKKSKANTSGADAVTTTARGPAHLVW